jgi:hypothetical protein
MEMRSLVDRFIEDIVIAIVIDPQTSIKVFPSLSFRPPDSEISRCRDDPSTFDSERSG